MPWRAEAIDRAHLNQTEGRDKAAWWGMGLRLLGKLPEASSIGQLGAAG
ncbi:MAG: hypothetical protein QXS68_08535 [Candidatus Methanomethylicaceae archaeon]